MNRYEPKHARCYCVAIAGAVATVAGTAATVYNTSEKSKAAESAQGQLNSASNTDKYGRRVEPVPYNDRVATDENYMNYIGEDITDTVQGSLPDIFDISNQIDRRAERMRRRVSPDFYGTIRQEGENIAALERGVIPSDVVDSINRVVAQNLGGAVDPSAPNGGFAISATASDTARRLGLTSLDLMKTGMQLGPNWRTNVDSFLYTPEDAINGIFMPGMNVALGSAALQMKRDEAEYISANNIERSRAGADPAVRGGVNDALTMGAIRSQTTQNQADALIGLVNSGVNLYSAVKPKQTTSPGGAVGTGSWRRNASGQGSAYRGV